VTVAGPGMEPISTIVVVAGQTSVTVVLDVPVGPGRTFTVEAFDEAGVTLFSGSTTADVWGEDLAVAVAMEIVIEGTVATPVFSPSGGTFTAPVEVALSSETPEALVYYTENGSTPSADTGILYTGPFLVSTSTTLRAVAVRPGWADSAESQAGYTITGTVATPMFAPSGGTFTAPVEVTISSDTPGAAVYYTVDGSTPSATNGTLIAASAGTVLVTSSTTLNAIAFRDGWTDSSVGTATYTILPQLATPQITPGTGPYNQEQWEVEVSAPPGALLSVTTDGSTPTQTNGTLTTNPGESAWLTVDRTITVKAFAFQADWADSEVATAVFTMQVATPQIDPAQTVYNASLEESAIVSISSVTQSATIHYTTDGSTPTTASPIFTSPMTVWTTTTLRALGVRAGWSNSAVAAKTYEFFSQVAIPAFVQVGTVGSGLLIEVTTSTPGSQIRYTLDGSTPSETAGTLLPSASPVVFVDLSTPPTTLQAIAFQAGWLPSDVQSQVYGSILIARSVFQSDLAAPPTAVGDMVLAAGGAHTDLVETDGTAWSWGDNASGQLGVGDAEDRWAPAQIATPVKILGVAAGADHSVALSQQGTVLTWGRNDFGQLGVGDRVTRFTPSQVTALPPIVDVGAGDGYCLALSWDGSLQVWGRNDRGQLGLADREDRLVPTPLPGVSGVAALAAGADHTLALAWDGTLWAWGGNDRGQLGLGDTGDRPLPQRVPGLSGIVAVAAGGGHSLALDGAGTVWVWGRNERGQLGLGDTMDRLLPEPLPLPDSLVEITAGGHHSLARSADGALWAWGGNDRGQLGQKDGADRWSPTPVAGIPPVATAAAGGEHTLILTTEGMLWSWGANASGQLGLGDTLDRFAPVALP
ncbi:MAG TPA: chitobiase/beta-hexosaminidase C-terminal domain-containing protein, partial [Deferrisomatales bacterium]|nr:chitobiase/beta-hexosaminidase C-terminal domain-containing protein [Deferrisomatales bacterium]